VGGEIPKGDRIQSPPTRWAQSSVALTPRLWSAVRIDLITELLSCDTKQRASNQIFCVGYAQLCKNRGEVVFARFVQPIPPVS